MRIAPPFVALALISASLPAQDYYVVTIGGAPVGWMRETRIATGAEIRSESFMSIKLNRLGSAVVMETSQSFTETAGGAMRALDVGMKMSQQEVTTSVVIDGRRAKVTATVGGRPFARELPLTDSILGPDAIRRLTLTLDRGGDSVRFTSWDGQTNAPATITRTLVARDSLRRILERSSATPMTTLAWLDDAGRTVRLQFELPFGRTEVILADSVRAMLAAAGGELPAESYGRTIARTNIRLPRAREIDYLKLRLSLADSSVAIPDLSGPGQHVLDRRGPLAVVEIRRQQPRTRAMIPVEPTEAIREYLEPNAYIQSDDPRLMTVAREIAGSERDLMKAALALRRWTAEQLTFDLGIAFAPSVEVFDRRRGTCVAYATLLATLTRAVGIPSRIAMGYVYVNGMFGGHAWTEVLVGTDWIPIDAALVSDGPSDAARFAFAWSSLRDGPGSLIAGGGTQLYGRLKVDVEAFRVAGQRRRNVSPGATPWTISGNRYQNTWLGIQVTKPAGFEFTRLDEVWPSATVVAFERGDERVTVSLRSRKPWARSNVATNEVPRGMDSFIIEAESNRKDALISETRRRIRTID